MIFFSVIYTAFLSLSPCLKSVTHGFYFKQIVSSSHIRMLLIEGEAPPEMPVLPCLCSLLSSSRSNLVPNSTLQDHSGVELELKTQLLPSTTFTTCYQSKAAKPSVSVPPRCLYHTNANSISPSGLIRVLKQLLLL